MSYSITKNTTLLTGASILQKIVSFIFFTLVARFLGAEDTSQYFLAMSFALIFTVVADFGLTPVLTREISKFQNKAEDYLNSIFWLKFIFGLSAYFLIILTANILNYDDLTKNLIYVAGLTVFFDNLTSAVYAYLRSQKNLLYESIAIFVSQFLTLIIGTLVLFLGLPMFGLILAYTIPSFLNFWVSLFFVRYKYNIIYHFKIDKKIIKLFLLIAIPFALAGIINRLYSYTDTLIMSKILTKNELGWWSVPYKVIFAFQFLPSALTISIFPVLSSLYLIDKNRVKDIFLKAWNYLLLISFPMAFGLLVLSKPLIFRIYTQEYEPSVKVLQILGFALIFIFLSYTNGTLLNSINKQKTQTLLVFYAWILSTFFNLLLIPKYGIYGAAWTCLFTNMFLFIVGYFYINIFLELDHFKIIKNFIKVFISSVIMAFAVYLFLPISLVLSIPFGVIVYFVVLYLIGGLDKNILENFFSIFKNNKRLK